MSTHGEKKSIPLANVNQWENGNGVTLSVKGHGHELVASGESKDGSKTVLFHGDVKQNRDVRYGWRKCKPHCLQSLNR